MTKRTTKSKKGSAGTASGSATETKNNRRPGRYTDAVAEELCARLIAGESLTAICDAEEMPGKRTVLDWLSRGDRGEEPYATFRARYGMARELQQDMLLDEILTIADDSRNDWIDKKFENGTVVRALDKEAVHRSRLRIDARFRLAEKLAPKKYGPRVDLSHEINPENPLKAIVRACSQQPDIPPGAYDEDGNIRKGSA